MLKNRFLVALLVVALFSGFMVMAPKAANAWKIGTTTAQAVCSNGKADIKVSIKNDEPNEPKWSMKITASAEGASADLGDVPGGSTGNGTIHTGKKSISSGTVTFKLVWSDGRDEPPDYRTADYSGVECKSDKPPVNPPPPDQPVVAPKVVENYYCVGTSYPQDTDYFIYADAKGALPELVWSGNTEKKGEISILGKGWTIYNGVFGVTLGHRHQLGTPFDVIFVPNAEHKCAPIEWPSRNNKVDDKTCPYGVAFKVMEYTRDHIVIRMWCDPNYKQTNVDGSVVSYEIKPVAGQRYTDKTITFPKGSVRKIEIDSTNPVQHWDFTFWSN